jgi:hypothetical protein
VTSNLFSLFGTRVVDYLQTSPSGGLIADEAKVGYVDNTADTLTQIARDAELLRDNTVQQVVWHLFTNPARGTGGVNPNVIQALQNAGIQYEMH